jgi:hypothetical protein
MTRSQTAKTSVSRWLMRMTAMPRKTSKPLRCRGPLHARSAVRAWFGRRDFGGS